MYKATLNYWKPRNELIVSENGFCFTDTTSVITTQKTIENTTEIGLFEQFYKLNNSLRYCNGSHYTFKDKELEQKYQIWLKSDDYKQKSFNLFYGGGVVD